MAIEAVEKEQAELKGQFDQFDKRVERMQTDVDNTKSELTQAINRLFDKIGDVNSRMDAGFRDLRDELKQEIQSAKQEFGNTRNWQISCVIAAVIAVCAVAGLLIK
ncbi:MAG: hypothetical protein F4Y39_15440 [Gemmatimonadetes bacterium]|nr:hypothetical protein [Gemmatimonadota bacterium]MYC15114.1 hypothetical protein [Gemmatimonadota bacterium]MYD61096.1 hypothetical protein [Gemmatimonadota bacterium]MYF72740.1 hypothetical protein [Gemmatimonadota bacterium]MYK54379.1 hypothetical protein [Gemmatimonadota bacterium]